MKTFMTMGVFSFFFPKNKYCLKLKELDITPAHFISSASMVLALGKLLPSRACLHPHTDNSKVVVINQFCNLKGLNYIETGKPYSGKVNQH